MAQSDFTGKVITITGAASGIGLATAQILASQGATLSLADINLQALDQLVRSLPPPRNQEHQQHLASAVDVRSSSSVNSWIDRTVEKFGRLDGAANVAGLLQGEVPFVDETDEGFDRTIDVNVKGVFYCMRAQAKAMKERGGAIVNVASVGGLVGFPGQASYIASKHAVIGLTKTLAREHANIRTNAVAPGLVATPMLKGLEGARGGAMSTAHTCLDRQAEPNEIATVIAFLLGDNASFVTGATWTVDGGWLV